MGRAQEKLTAGGEDLVAAGNLNSWKPALSLGRDVYISLTGITASPWRETTISWIIIPVMLKPSKY